MKNSWNYNIEKLALQKNFNKIVKMRDLGGGAKLA